MSNLMYINPYRPEGVGSENVCIMFHGLFGMSINLMSLAKGLATDIYPVVMDLPNHGNSPTMDPCNFVEMAKMLDNTIESEDILKNANIHVLGHSLGGKLAMVYALMYPEKTHSLVIMDIAPVTYPPFHLEVMVAFHEIEEKKPADRNACIEILTAHNVDKGTATFLAKNFMFEDGYVGSKIRVKEIEKNYEDLRSFPFDEMEGKIFNNPTFVLKATDTDYFSDKYIYEVDKYFPSWELETIEDSGHNIHVDNFKDTKELISGFYQEIV